MSEGVARRLCRAAPRLLLLVAAALFVPALFLPQIATCARLGDGSIWFHWFDQSTVVFFGWGGFLVLQFGWFANLTAIAIGMRVWNRAPVSPVLATLHALLAASAMLPIRLPHNEAYDEPVCFAGYGPGFWMWLVAQILMLLAAVAGRSVDMAEDG